MRTIILKVTRVHIERGRPISYTYGPIANAIRDRCCAGVFVQIIHGEVFLCRYGRRWWIQLPQPALHFTRRVNARLPCSPISFRMDLPADLLPARSNMPRRRPPEIATLSHGRDRRSVA